MPEISALEKLRHEDLEFEVILGEISEILSQNKNNKFLFCLCSLSSISFSGIPTLYGLILLS
jgi:hypothetical protein